MVLKGFSKNPLTHGLANGLTNRIRAYAAKPELEERQLKYLEMPLSYRNVIAFFPLTYLLAPHCVV